MPHSNTKKLKNGCPEFNTSTFSIFENIILTAELKFVRYEDINGTVISAYVALHFKHKTNLIRLFDGMKRCKFPKLL